MSTDSIIVELEDRKTIKKGLNKLKAEGKVPAVIHNHGEESIHVQGDYMALRRVFSAAGKHHPVELKVGAKKHLALIRDVDFEPTKQQIRHMVFQAIRQDQETEAEVPIVFREVEIPAEKASLLVLKHIDNILVKALPKDLPDEIYVDPSKLTEVGDTLTVADLEVPANVTIMTDPEHGIATVEMPRDQVAEADAAAAELSADKEASEAGEKAEAETTEKAESASESEAAT